MARCGFLAATLWLCLTGCGNDSLQGLGADENPPINEQETKAPECYSALDCGNGEVCSGGTCICINPPCSSGAGGDNGGNGNGGGDNGGNGGGDNGGGDNGGGDNGGGDTEDPYPFVGGSWRTEYHFDWSDYMGPLADLGTPLDYVDQLFLGTSQLGDLPIVGELIEDFVEEYIPEWVQELVHVLNNVVHFFEDVQIDGLMQLQHQASDPMLLAGSEEWQMGYVQVIANCTYGEADPNYPACAQVPVPLNDYMPGFGSIDVEAHDFTGYLTMDRIYLDDREVDIEIGQFMLYVLDEVTYIATNGQYDGLDAALAALIDCNGLAYDLEAWLCGYGICSNEAFYEMACVAAVDLAIAEVEDQLLQIDVDWEVMRFDQEAALLGAPAQGQVNSLGSASNPGQVVDGEFEVMWEVDLTGSWFGVRP